MDKPPFESANAFLEGGFFVFCKNANSKLKNAKCKMQIQKCKLQTANSKMQSANSKLKTRFLEMK